MACDQLPIAEPEGPSFISVQLRMPFGPAMLVAARYRLPAVYPFRFYAELGGLFSYGNDQLDNFQRGAAYADRILESTKPSELPAEEPTVYHLVVNPKTVKTLGLNLPQSLLLRAEFVQ